MSKCSKCGKSFIWGVRFTLQDSTGKMTDKIICEACNNQLIENNQGIIFDETTGKVKVFDVKQEEFKLEKDVDSIARYFQVDAPAAAAWKDAIRSMVVSMRDDEKILYAFRCVNIFKNRGQECIANAMTIITNRRFYYAGADANHISSYLKSGSIELKDVHAVTIGKVMPYSYIQFEIKNEDYRINFNSALTHMKIVHGIKEKLEEGIRACETAEAAPVVVQNALSAADELKKFKELLDLGIVTQEEFDAKKKQLLGL